MSVQKPVFVLLSVAVLLLVIGAVVVFLSHVAEAPAVTTVPSDDQVKEVNDQPPSETPTVQTNGIVREAATPDRKVYINQDWRFSFEYPADWEVSEPKLKSRASMLKILLTNSDNHFPDPITVHVFPKWWIDRLLTDIEKQDNQPRTVLINGREAVVSSFPDMGIPSEAYKVLVNDEYWIDIAGKLDYDTVPGYAEELELVHSTFQFHEPLPTLDELDVDPYIPDHVQASTNGETETTE